MGIPAGLFPNVVSICQSSSCPSCQASSKINVIWMGFAAWFRTSLTLLPFVLLLVSDSSSTPLTEVLLQEEDLPEIAHTNITQIKSWLPF